MHIKAHSTRLKDHSGNTVGEYLQAKGRSPYLKDFQLVDALKILFVGLLPF